MLGRRSASWDGWGAEELLSCRVGSSGPPGPLEIRTGGKAVEVKVPLRLDFLWHLPEGVRLLSRLREDDLQWWDTLRAAFLFVLLRHISVGRMGEQQPPELL